MSRHPRHDYGEIMMEFDVFTLVLFVLAGALSLFTAWSFFKAGKFKATASKETMLGAGFGWIGNIPFATVRAIAYLEIAGAIGLVASPVAYIFGLEFAIWLAVAAAAGLALTMVGAMIVHGARKESQYTLKMNLSLFAVSVLSAVGWVLVAVL